MIKRFLILITSISIVFLSLLFFLTNYNKKTRLSAVGKYLGTAPTTLEKAKLALSNIECFYSERELELLPDSTFTLKDSAITITGTWSQKKDLFEFHVATNKQHYNDSLYRESLPGKPIQDFTMDYFNPDLYYFLPQPGRNCIEIFKIK